MPILRIKIDGQEVDIDESRRFPLKLDFQIEDITDFTKRKGGGSTQTYRLPGTPFNQKVFGIFGTVTALNGALLPDDLRTLKDAVIEVDNIPIAHGQVQLVSVSRAGQQDRRRGVTYNVAFFTGNADWIVTLAGKVLTDIDWSDLDHDFTTANVVAGTSKVISQGQGYGYTLVKYKDWINQGSGYLVYEDYTPFLYAEEILTRMFALAGYTVSGPGFFGADPFDAIHHPFPLRNYDEAFFTAKTDVVADLQTTQVIVGLSSTVIYDNEIQDNGNNYTPGTGIFVAPFDMTYRVKATCTINNIVQTPGTVWRFRVLKNNSILIPAGPDFFTIVNGDTLTREIVVPLVAGDDIRMLVGGSAGLTSFDITAGDLEITGVEYTWTIGTSEVFWEFLLPSWNLLDYLKGLTEVFNLWIDTDVAAKTVRILPREQYFSSEKDRTQDLDFQKLGEKKLLLIEDEIIYQYKSDSNDDTLKQLDSTEKFPLFTAIHNASDPNATGIRIIENSFFAPTIALKDPTISGFGGLDTAPLIPMLWPENYIQVNSVTETDFIFEPRILYYVGRTGALPGSAPSAEGTVSINVTGPTLREAWPKSIFVDYDNATRFSLSYGSQIVAGVSVDGLMRNYFLGQLTDINIGVQNMEWLRLKITDIITNDFSEIIKLHGIRYVLQKISGFNPLSVDSTKVVLLRHECPAQSDIDRIDSITKKGLING